MARAESAPGAGAAGADAAEAGGAGFLRGGAGFLAGFPADWLRDPAGLRGVLLGGSAAGWFSLADAFSPGV